MVPTTSAATASHVTGARGQDRQWDPDDDRDEHHRGQADHPASTRRGRR